MAGDLGVARLRSTQSGAVSTLRREIWPKPTPIVLDREDMAVEVRDPLLAFDRQLEISQRITDIGFDVLPEKCRVFVNHIRRAGIAAALCHAGLGKLVVERIQTPQVQRIREL